MGFWNSSTCGCPNAHGFGDTEIKIMKFVGFDFGRKKKNFQIKSNRDLEKIQNGPMLTIWRYFQQRELQL